MVSAISRLQLAYLSRKLTPLRLGGGSYIYLVMIAENPGITQSELVDLVIIDRATVSKMLVYLENEGLIQRKPHPTDGRAIVLDPTEKGKAVYEEAIEITTEYRRLMLDGVPEEEQAAALSALHRIAGNLRRANGEEKKARAGASAPRNDGITPT